MHLLIQALERPFEWTLTQTSPTQGHADHPLGCRLNFSIFSSTDGIRLRCSLATSEPFWSVDLATVNPDSPYPTQVLQDPKPRLATPVPKTLFILNLPRFDTAAFCQTMDQHLGPTAWARLRSIMMAVSLHWQKPGGYWQIEEGDEIITSFERGRWTSFDVPDTHAVQELLDRLRLVVFQNQQFCVPQNFVLGHTYTQHDRLSALNAWGDDVARLPDWIVQTFS